MRHSATRRCGPAALGARFLAAFAAVAASVAAFTAVAGPRAVADVVLMNGRIYTVDPARPWAEAVAIRDGRYVYVGTAKGARAYVGRGTKRIDLGGAFAMPGLTDAHVHPVMGSLTALYECNFPFTATPDEVVKTLAACVAKVPAGTWIRGGQWDSGFFERFRIESPKQFLDAISDRHPIVLNDDSLHNVWVNTRAIAAAKLDANSPDPAGGKIVRGADGEPNGLMLETAARLYLTIVPPFTPEQHQAAVREVVHRANAYGLTSLKDAGAYESYAAAYQAVDRAGDLTLNVATCLRTPYGARTEPLDYAALEAQRDRYRSTHVHTAFVKIFMDGVPTPARTAAMLAPYLPDAAHGANYTGDAHLATRVLAHDLVELDRRGFTVKMHSAGDRSVRMALDAIEAARKANGDSGLRHELAHAGYIDPADIPRFAQLNAVADYSPILWHPSPIIAAIVSALGNRAYHYWPTRSLLDAKAPMLAGSDWPAAVPDQNPWVGVEALVTRRDPRGKTALALWPEEAISLDEALRLYTLESAKALRLERTTGSIEVGKSADFVVLDRNLFEVPIEDVGDTQVRSTWFEGKLVYEAPN
jgi:predicted amidohydrolase YtcJ